MRSPEMDSDEPLTPAGRLFLQKETNQVIHCIIGTTHPLDVDALREAIEGSLILKHPRFTSIMVRDSKGREHWRRTQIDIHRHIISVEEPVGPSDLSSDEAAVNWYVADLSTSSGLTTDKPLWEIHILRAHSCLVCRIHHCLGDGISLMSLFLTSCRRVDDPDALPTIHAPKKKEEKEEEERKGKRDSREWWRLMVRMMAIVWFTVVFVVEFILRSLWVRDRRTPVSGGAGVELWPRELATARFRLDDMKVVKSAVANATINDVLFGIISAGLFRYLDRRFPNVLQDGTRMTGVAMVNLREQPGLQELSDMMKGNPKLRWGNKFGILLLPIEYQKNCNDPLEYLRKAKAMIDRKKNSLEAHFSYKLGDLVMSYLGAHVASLLNYRIVCNTTFTISNVVGPLEEIATRGHPVTYIRATSSSLPHALTMHMVSYAGRADMQILVAKEIIPDPNFLAKCFEDTLLEMKAAAAAVLKT